jgi:hypothetical protein
MQPLETSRQSKTPAKLRERYRVVLSRPDLTDREIDAMREHVIRLARTVCEHVWGKQCY